MDLLFNHISPEDATKLGVTTCVSAALCALGLRMNAQQCNVSELKYETEALKNDPILVQAFIQLQQYHALAPVVFKRAFLEADLLLFLEQTLTNRQVFVRASDRKQAWRHFSVCANRLTQMKKLVKEHLTTGHRLVVHDLVLKIYEQLQKHIGQVLDLCRDFHPDLLIQHAPEEISELQKRKHTHRRSHRKNRE